MSNHWLSFGLDELLRDLNDLVIFRALKSGVGAVRMLAGADSFCRRTEQRRPWPKNYANHFYRSHSDLSSGVVPSSSYLVWKPC